MLRNVEGEMAVSFATRMEMLVETIFQKREEYRGTREWKEENTG